MSLPRETLKWILSLDLSYPVKNVRRDFANGFLVAEILSRYYPQDVAMHSFENVASMQRKKQNWHLLEKLFKRKQIPVDHGQVEAAMAAEGDAAVDIVQQLHDFIHSPAFQGGADRQGAGEQALYAQAAAARQAAQANGYTAISHVQQLGAAGMYGGGALPQAPAFIPAQPQAQQLYGGGGAVPPFAPQHVQHPYANSGAQHLPPQQQPVMILPPPDYGMYAQGGPGGAYLYGGLPQGMPYAMAAAGNPNMMAGYGMLPTAPSQQQQPAYASPQPQAQQRAGGGRKAAAGPAGGKAAGGAGGYASRAGAGPAAAAAAGSGAGGGYAAAAMQQQPSSPADYDGGGYGYAAAYAGGGADAGYGYGYGGAATYSDGAPYGGGAYAGAPQPGGRSGGAYASPTPQQRGHHMQGGGGQQGAGAAGGGGGGGEAIPFSKARPVEFQPYDIKDFEDKAYNVKRNGGGYWQLGRLGPDLETEELQAKREKAERVKALAAQVREENMKKAALAAAKPKREAPKEPTARDKALEFAKNVPKPEAAPPKPPEPPAPRRGGGGAVVAPAPAARGGGKAGDAGSQQGSGYAAAARAPLGTPPSMLQLLEAQHAEDQRKVEAIRSQLARIL